ncbi:hypothetical protein PR202_ga20798 [Eleusine coracana subsp. coracana]|uniref:Uncharacterized protein n=1 Tax=Eleusine coracana subsp. coracana TaxID=191504 RepID=A0AAV5CZ01_ELECO|nr:hypothetical protein PR202_ga20798 [Eleusine coracana subsp. coracana]
MELAAAAISSLLPKLGSLLTGEYKLHKGVRGEIRFLQAEMEMMQAALKKVSKLPPNQIDDDVKIWARDLKELCYDIEDSVDDFLVRIDAPIYANPKGFRRFFDRTLGLLTKANNRRHIATDIKEIKRRIEEVATRRERYKFQDTALQPDEKPIDPRVLASFVDAAKLVGVEGPTEKIVSLLTHGKGGQKQNLKVVSIVGVGGLGKTTIANSVYQKLGGEFHCQAFVSVSLKPNVKQIFSSILRQITQDTCSNAGEKEPEELIRCIRKFLMDKRYLIVIDDLWDKEAWNTINSALIDNNLDSKVILTTPQENFATISEGSKLISPVLQIRRLSVQVFVEKKTPHDLAEIGNLTELRMLSIYRLENSPSLYIRVKELGQDDLQLLGALPVLRFLNLEARSMPVWLRGGGVIPAPEVRLVIGSDHPFRSLAEFEFLGLRSWLVFAQGFMPKLQRLKLDCDVNVMKRNGGWLDVGLENLTSLERICITAYPDLEVEEAKTMIRDVIDIHPNHPTLELVQPSTYQDRFK